MPIDHEILALNQAWEAIRPLEAKSKMRVIDYLMRRVGPELVMADPPPNPRPAFSRLGPDWRRELGHWLAAGRFPRLTDRTLLVAGLLQSEYPGKDFSAAEIHQPLKDLGRPVGNISAHLGSMQKRTGTNKDWIIQTAGRDGSGRKRYSVTDRGMDAVRAMIDYEITSQVGGDPLDPA